MGSYHNEYVYGTSSIELGIDFKGGRVTRCDGSKIHLIYKEIAEYLSIEELFYIIKEKVRKRGGLIK